MCPRQSSSSNIPPPSLRPSLHNKSSKRGCFVSVGMGPGACQWQLVGRVYPKGTKHQQQLSQAISLQSDSANRKRRFLTGRFRLELLRLDSSGSSYVCRVDFIVFVLFLEEVGARPYYCCKEIEKRFAALCFAVLREPRVLGLDEPSSQRVG